MVEPAVVPVGTPACLSIVMAGSAGSGVLVLSPAVTGEPVGGVPAPVALLSTTPASRSAWVMR